MNPPVCGPNTVVTVVTATEQDLGVYVGVYTCIYTFGVYTRVYWSKRSVYHKPGGGTAHVVTRNRHKEGIQLWLASLAPATGLDQNVHMVGPGNSKACAVCNEDLMVGCRRLACPKAGLTVLVDDSATEFDAQLRGCPHTYCVVFTE